MRRGLVLAVVLAADVMDLLDNTVTAVAGPSMRADLGGGEALLQWLGAAYTLPFAMLLVLGGRLGDLHGRRRMFLLGSAGFTASSGLCAVAPTPAVLIAARALQGGFGALLIPQGFGILKQVYREDCGRAFAAFGPVMGLSAVAGPVVAGALIGADLFGTGWRAVFLLNAPLGALALLGAWRVLPHHRPTGTGRLDAVGALLLSLSALAVIYPLVEGRELGWPAWTFVLLATGLVGAAGFAGYERWRDRDHLVTPTLLANATYVTGVVVALTFFAATSGLLLVVSLFAQLGLGFTPLRAGLTLAPLSFGIAGAAIVSYPLVAKLGRHVLHAGLAVMTVGLLVLATTAGLHRPTTIAGLNGPATTAWRLVPALLVCGLGMGLVFAPLFDIILAGVADHEVGSASGLLNAVQQLAAAVGVAVVATVFFALQHQHGSAPQAMARTALLTLIPVALTALLAFKLPRTVRQNAER